MLIVLFIGLTIALVERIRHSARKSRGPAAGKIAGISGVVCAARCCARAWVAQRNCEHSKSTKFCLSCHIMEPYGQSLRVDDPTHLAAAHFQNHRVPPDEACYTCHTNYAMFGGMKAKLGGLKHIYVYYLATPPAPEDIKLYEPFNNRECLHCHAGARSFEEGAVHTADPDLLPAIKANKLSCLSSGCHETVHDVKTLKKQKFWKGAG